MFPSLCVVVVEDSEDDYRLLLRQLCSLSPRVDSTWVQNAQELATALAEKTFDAVISDHVLPDYSSLEALQQVRAFDPDLPFIILSGTMGEEHAIEALHAGADDYLIKERLNRLAPALERVLNLGANRRARRQAEAALQESETRFGALTENLPGMVFQMRYSDNKLSLLYVSEGSYRVLGVAPDEFLARPSLLFNSLAVDAAAELRGLLMASAATKPYLSWEGQLQCHAGEEPRWIEIVARSRKLESGAVLWDGIVSDATAAKLARLALREHASHLAHVREEERESIARELHDDVGSTLFAVKFELAWLKAASRETPLIAAKLQEVDQLVEAVITSSARMTHDLRPGIIDEGLVASLEWQARTFERRMGIRCTFQASQEAFKLDRDSELAMFRVCQEALNNVAKHSKATRVDIRLDATEDALMLEIHDNGVGISAADMAKRACFGLRGMKERANSLGGEVEIRGSEASGTTIAFALFLDSALTDQTSIASE